MIGPPTTKLYKGRHFNLKVKLISKYGGKDIIKNGKNHLTQEISSTCASESLTTRETGLPKIKLVNLFSKARQKPSSTMDKLTSKKSILDKLVAALLIKGLT